MHAFGKSLAQASLLFFLLPGFLIPTSTFAEPPWGEISMLVQGRSDDKNLTVGMFPRQDQREALWSLSRQKPLFSSESSSSRTSPPTGNLPPLAISPPEASSPPPSSFWRSQKRKWAGWGLLGSGIAVTLTTALLMGFAANDRLPVPGDCGWYSGVRGDPCTVDWDQPGTKAVFGISLTIGIGAMTTGTVFLLSP